jgi:hypothetical protein
MPPAERGGAESAAEAVIIRPALAGTVTAVPDGVDAVAVTVPLTPAVGRRQRVVLILNEHHPADQSPGQSYIFLVPPRDPNGPASVATVTVRVTGVVPDDYVVRVQVDGAESVLTAGADGRFDLPRVTIP